MKDNLKIKHILSFLLLSIFLKANSEPNFELWNKYEKGPIYYSVGDKDFSPYAKKFKKIGPNQWDSDNINLNNETIVLISAKDPKENDNVYEYIVKAGKTVYATLRLDEKNNTLTFGAQTGPWFGFFNETKRGYSLANNFNKDKTNANDVRGKVVKFKAQLPPRDIPKATTRPLPQTPTTQELPQRPGEESPTGIPVAPPLPEGGIFGIPTEKPKVDKKTEKTPESKPTLPFSPEELAKKAGELKKHEYEPAGDKKSEGQAGRIPTKEALEKQREKLKKVTEEVMSQEKSLKPSKEGQWSKFTTEQLQATLDSLDKERERSAIDLTKRTLARTSSNLPLNVTEIKDLEKRVAQLDVDIDFIRNKLHLGAEDESAIWGE